MEVLLKDLAPGENFIFQIRARNAAGVSPWSRAYNVETDSDVTPPNPVTSLTWDVSRTSFVATWVKPTLDSDGKPLKDFKAYRVTVTANGKSAVYYVTQERFVFSLDANIACFDTPQPTVGLEVRVQDNLGNLSTPVAATATNPIPADITNFVATGIAKGISVSWSVSADDDLKQYEVYMSTSAGFTPGSANRVYTGLGTSFVYPSVNSTIHYFKARAVDLFNQPSANYVSDDAIPLNTTDFDTAPPGVPTNVVATSGTESSGLAYIDVSWAAVTSDSLREYVVRYSKDQVAWQYATVPSDRTTARITGLVPNTDYYVGVASSSYLNARSLFAAATPAPIKTGKDTVAPSQPALPTVSIGTQIAQVSHNMKVSGGGDIESDVDYFEVHASVTTGFTPSTSTMRGVIPVTAPGVSVSGAFYFPADTSMTNLYWKVVAVDKAGNKSTPSLQAAGLPGLIAGVNILDATITNAKINDLSASKLVAGTAFINDLSIRSSLTIDATAGHIKSSNYNAANKTGWSLDQTGLFIYDGQIAAKSLLLQDSQNLVPNAFADFEFNSQFYHATNNDVNAITSSATSGVKLSAGTTGARINRQAMRIWHWDMSLTSPNTHWYTFAPGGLTASGVNIDVVPGEYILSAFVRKNGAVDQVVRLNVYTDTGVSIKTPGQDVTSTTNTLIYGTIVIPSGVQKIKIWVEFGPKSGFTGYDFTIDGVQFERKIGAIDTPSPWTPPSTTQIDGGNIVAGTIRSSAPSATVPNQPAWSINTAGNMQIGDALIRGSLVVGAGAEANSIVQSGNYVAGATGWIIKGDGSVEFNSGEFRGDLNLSTSFASKQYSLEASNSQSNWVWYPGNTLSGQEPTLVMQGWSFTPNAADTGYDAVKPFQTILRNTPMGQFQILFDPSQSTDPFVVDGANERNADGTTRKRYYGFVDKRMGIGGNREYNSVNSGAGARAEYSNLYYSQDAVVALSPPEMGSDARLESSLRLYSDADAYGREYYPTSSTELYIQGDNNYVSKNLVQDYLDIFDHPNGITYYRSNISPYRFTLDSIRTDLRMMGDTKKLRKGVSMTIQTTAAGANNPELVFAAPGTYPQTVVPGEEYAVSVWLAFPDTLDALQYRTFMRTNNGVTINSDWESVWHNGSVESYVSFHGTPHDNLLIVPAGATTARFGIEFQGSITVNTVMSMTGIEIFKVYEVQNGERVLVTAVGSLGNFQEVGQTGYAKGEARLFMSTPVTPVEQLGLANPTTEKHSYIEFYASDENTVRSNTYAMRIDPTGLQWGNNVEYRSPHGTHRLLGSTAVTDRAPKKLTFSSTISLTESTGQVRSSDWASSMGSVIDNAAGYTAFIAQRAGLFMISISVKVSPAVGSAEFHLIEIMNETNNQSMGAESLSGPADQGTATFLIPMSAGQRVYAQAYQESGVTKTYTSGSVSFAQIL